MDDNGVWIVPEPANNKSYTYKSLVQLDAETESDPICSSAGCVSAAKHSHPMDYFVPSYGRDPDMEGTEDSIDIA